MIESVRVVRIAARPVHALRPFALVRDLIARLLDQPGAAGCEPASFAALRRIAGAPNDVRNGDVADDCFESFTELLAAVAEEATTLISIDDMHVVDPVIWRFLSAAFRWSIDQHVHWLLAYRALHETELASLPEPSLLRRLPLACLERTHAARLVDLARSGYYSPLEFEQIFRRVGGHPALLAALARSECELPSSTEPIVDDWIARLSGQQFQILRTLATLGGSATTRSLLDFGFGRTELAVVLGELARHGIIEEASGVVCAHGVWADATLAAQIRTDHITINID
jgi:hypothetical protein